MLPPKVLKIFKYMNVGLGGLGVTGSPRDPRFAGSIPAEVVGFFQGVKILSTSPPGGRTNVFSYEVSHSAIIMKMNTLGSFITLFQTMDPCTRSGP